MRLFVVQALAHRSDEKAAQVTTILTSAAVDAELKVGSGEATLLSHHHISSCKIPVPWVAIALLGDCKRIWHTDFHLTAAFHKLAIYEK